MVSTKKILTNQLSFYSNRFRNYTSAVILLWTGIIILSAVWNFHQIKTKTITLASKEARSHFNKDQALRFWATTHGGVYVPANERTPSNPHLNHIPERDIITPSGKKLTLMNPAYMLRQIMEEYSELYGVEGHITSLKPLNSNNAPDEWEISALKAFENGKKEMSSFIDIIGEPYLRLMQPMITKKECLKCHAFQGYKIGDVRGSVGVSVPMSTYLNLEQNEIKLLMAGHFFIWLIVTIGIYFGFSKLNYHFTERLRSEEALRKNEQLFRKMIKKSPLPMVITDRNQDISFFNDKFIELFGYTLEDISTAEKWWEVVYPDEAYRDKVKDSWATAIEEAAINNTDIKMQEWDLTIKDRSKRRCEFYMVPLDDFSLIIMSDTTERNRIDNELKKKTRDIGERIKELRCLYAISTLLENHDTPMEVIFQSTVNLIQPAWQYPDITCSQIIIDNDRYKTDNFQVSKWKQCSNILIYGEKIGTVEVYYSKEMSELDEGPFLKEERELINEIAERIGRFIERKQAEEKSVKLEHQLRQAQKIESLGRLAGGVAHDYNNSLSVIIGYTEMAMEDVNPTEQLYANLNEVFMAAERATDITRQLLTFARKQAISPKVLEVNKNVESLLKMLQRLIGENIDLTWLPGANLWNVKMDATQIDQILVNLCINARDAIEEVGKITIETKNVTFDKDYCSRHAGFVSGEYTMLAVSDNGFGMDKEILDSIFEPFFTTKEINKGTGLGMSTVYGIVRQNKGFINVYSEPDIGTTVTIYLPRHEGKAIEIQGESTTESLPVLGETVLLVEDELAILRLTRKLLDKLGFTVVTANTPEKAIKIAEEHTGEIQLLITDVIMPEMNGRELAERLQYFYPDLKCIFMSGYTADVISHHGVLDDGVNFLQKPFSKTDLTASVRKVLYQ